MEKKRIKLENLNVKSFITNLGAKEKATVNGGASVLGVCIMSLDGQACQVSPIVIEESAICIPNTYDQGACTAFICTKETQGHLECPPADVREACSIYRRGSCGGTIGA